MKSCSLFKKEVVKRVWFIEKARMSVLRMLCLLYDENLLGGWRMGGFL